MELMISPTGAIRCLYAETLELAALGQPRILRASAVEPDPDGTWHADLSPVAGPRLSGFRCRSAALEAEVAWLRQHWLAAPG